MNLVLTFLAKNRHRLDLARLGEPVRFSCVMMTPRFRASSHIICFVFAADRLQPIFVIKIPRLPGDNERLDREVANLHVANRARGNEEGSIPHVVAYEDYHHHRLLIETVVPGRPMSPAIVRQQPELCLSAGLSWLLEFHLATTSSTLKGYPDWFERLVEQPMQQLKVLLPPSAEEGHLVDQTLALLRPLANQDLPLVMTHGDFSSPNILQDEAGRIGVVDWELAEPQGLPAFDLFFFLTYVAFARQNAGKNADYLKAFQRAFFGPQAWARSYVARYRERLHLALESVAPLFVLTWGRYVAGLVERLHESRASDEVIDHNTLKWLRSNRYYVLWRYALENVKKMTSE
ncbi:MAG: aminoglycoside phosphotransferase family protein [bacterium]